MPTKPGAFKYDYLGLDEASLKRSIANRLIYSVGKDPYTAKPRDWYHSVAYAVRDRLIERWMETMRTYYRRDSKRVYYLSLEFLIGRTLMNSLLNMDIDEEVAAALESIGLELEALREMEPDAALGNGGLGRLAACFLDSMATLRLPGYGYGIRYEYGMFNQRIVDGHQVETPENWLRYGNPWEFGRPEVLYPVHFYGRVISYHDEHGRLCHEWTETEEVMAMAYDTPIPGYQTNTVNNMRLWSAKSTREFDFRYFNEGNYIKAVEEKNASENLSRVLYPDDTTQMGRTLRLKQQYLFVSASVQDILGRYLRHHDSLDALPDKVAIQLNDTHPSIAIPELMRLLLDVHHLDWEQAWSLTRRTFAYTNHTLLPEALETWPVALMERLLPRHMQIIYEINHRFLDEVRHRWPGDVERLRRMSLIDETPPRQVRMAHLAMVGSHRVNGVSRLHTELMRDTIFRDFDAFYPERIINITNGVTPRRWLQLSNPRLSRLISGQIGRGWVQDLERLRALEPAAEDAAFRAAFREVKLDNKRELAEKIASRLGIEVDPHSLFDVQIKRIHEYKRQLLNLLHVVHLYNRIRDGEVEDGVPRTVIFAGKAAPGYAMAKLIIKLIHDVADIVNNDPLVGGRLKVVFIPNYDVTTAQDIIPAADLSEQISTAGMEASGTGNMKLGLNGALTIGTLDGANVEMQQAVGEDNIFIFGLDRDGVAAIRREGHDPWRYYREDAGLRRVMEMIGGGYFSVEEPSRFRPVVDALLAGGDHYLLLADFADYCAAQRRVEALYLDEEEWTRRAILNVARLGYFSSDRSIAEYAEKIWGVSPEAHA
ncbi:glycogen/starch/alpha-glucan phosphorylase [Thiohalobacter sp. IOR34]|uniref:glycogen/starch/alpha-glucan phosphorylase n=1 Tax=Thiohalobacter sp. IOR34 TaxID=3057176 RepID=UPI0025B1DC2C|nr:glycogen/starch/alpha-glucan phosphorylase [Thiohalobacter sp. IOR34]WJW75184.1 glycogen/starch/alpha-glucan phosphorylase [Thiohalobacter sp. IOR34]